MTLQDDRPVQRPPHGDDDQEYNSRRDEQRRHQVRRRRVAGVLVSAGTGSWTWGSVLLVAAAVAVVLVLLLVMSLMLLAAGDQPSQTVPGTACDAGMSSTTGPDGMPAPAGGGGGAGNISPVQRQAASTIVGVAKAMGISPRGQIVGIATAMQESHLGTIGMNTAEDHDSLGLFQQRPSQGWGSPDQIKNPIYAASRFFQRLMEKPGWEQMPVTDAAQKVQGSAFPGAYAQWQDMAVSLATQLAGTPPIAGAAPAPAPAGGAQAAAGPGAQAGMCAPPAAPGAPAPAPGAAGAAPGAPGAAPSPPPSGVAAAAIQAAAAEQGKPYVWGAVGPDSFDCSGLMQTAFRKAGITLPRTASQQYGAGPHFPVAAAQPGDLVFYASDQGDPATIHHVALYLGNGQMLEAPEEGKPVRITPVRPDELVSTVTRPAGAPAVAA